MALLLPRRSFLFAAPAIIAASSLMRVHSKYITRTYTVRLEGYDQYNNRITAILYDDHSAKRVVATHTEFKFIRRLVLV